MSLVGDAAFVTALGWRTFTLAGSGKLGIVLVYQSLAVLATVLIGGALADRLPRLCIAGLVLSPWYALAGVRAVVRGTCVGFSIAVWGR